MNLSFLNILMLFGALQGLLLVLILFSKKQKNAKARFYLALILFGLSMNLLYYFGIVSGISDTYPEFRLIYLPWSMLSAIAFYLYISFITPFKKELTTLNKLGFLPFVFFSILLCVVKFSNYFSITNSAFSSEFVSQLLLIEEYVGIVFTLCIGYLSYKKLNKIELELQQHYSNYNSFKLQFHKRFLIVALIFCGIWTLSVTYVQLNNISSLSIYFSIWLFMAFVIQWIAWTGFIKDEALIPVFKKDSSQKDNHQEFLEVDFKIEEPLLEINKNLKLNTDSEYYKSLISLFENEQIFLQPELTLEILSSKMNISKSYLSALINPTTGKNFYNFVNSYRADYLISLFKKNKTKNFTILSLAYEAGFNSKSTFQSFFKKYTGKTPSQYIKALQLTEVIV